MACNNAKPQAKPYKLSDGQGLTLEVMPNGSKLWRQRYRFSGKEKAYSLGPYPALSLKDARHKSSLLKFDIRNGIDPSEVKKKEKRNAILNAKNTFEALALEWHDRHGKTLDKKHASNIISRLKRDIFPVIGSTPIADLEAPDIAAVIKKIEDRGAGEMARRALQNCAQVIRYAVQTGRAKYDVTSGLKGFLKPRVKTHYGTIKLAELPNLVSKIKRNDARLFKQTRIALELMLLTFVRTSELINAKWSEFDFDTNLWTIPAERMKMRQEHVVPMSDQVIALLADLDEVSGHREYLFPSIPRPNKPMSNATLLSALEKLGYHKTMTGHGFRALAATALQEKLDVPYDIIDRQLAHRPKGKVEQAYNRAQFLEKRVVMMQQWADYIDQIKLPGPTVDDRQRGRRRSNNICLDEK